MYKKILVPLDGSSLAECVLPHIEAIAKPKGSHVDLISIIEPVDIPTRGKIALSEEDLKRLDAEVKQETIEYLDGIVERLTKYGVEANAVIIYGKPAEALIEYASSNHIDLLIMATHGRSGITKWFWGSVTDKVLRAIHIPVLLIKAEGCELEE